MLFLLYIIFLFCKLNDLLVLNFILRYHWQVSKLGLINIWPYIIHIICLISLSNFEICRTEWYWTYQIYSKCVFFSVQFLDKSTAKFCLIICIHLPIDSWFSNLTLKIHHLLYLILIILCLLHWKRKIQELTLMWCN